MATTAPASAPASRRAGQVSWRSSFSRAVNSRRARHDPRPMILAGDVGDTKTLLAVFDPGAGMPAGMSIVREASLPSQEIESVESAVEAFLLGAPRLKVRAACLCVAGPIVDGRCVATNLPWEVHERRRSEERRVG